MRLQSLKATIGQGFINLFTPVIKAVNVVLERLSAATAAFKNFTETVMGGKSASSGMAQMSGEMAEVQTGYEGAAAGAEEFADGVEDAGKQAIRQSDSDSARCKGKFRKYGKQCNNAAGTIYR